MTWVKIDRLGAAVPELHRFTFPRYRPLLAQLGDAKDPTAPFALCASIGEQPAGLAVFSRVFDPSRRSLLSVMVDPLLRRRGVGTQLLQDAEALVRDAGVATLVTVHSSRAPARAAFEALLRRCGWTAPRDRLVEP